MGSRTKRRIGVWACLALWLPGIGASEARAQAELEGAAIDEIVGVLHGKGLIDDEQRDRILFKHHAEQVRAAAAPAVGSGWLEGFEWFGDLRLRGEGYWYDRDNDESELRRDNRTRFRYRARFGFTKQVNDWARVGVRLASGSCFTDSETGLLADCGDSRSTNRTLGDDADFDPDEIFIDRAWADLRLPTFAGVEARLHAGKIANPFRWSHGKDMIVWDADLNPEGAALLANLPLGENAKLFLNAGAFIAEENSTSKDPKVIALQLGGESRLTERLSGGLRLSGYEWRSLDNSNTTTSPDFIPRALAQGNLPSAYDSRARIGELAAFLSFGLEEWPILVYGAAARNFTADSAVLGGFPVDAEDTAWGAGLEVGDKKKWGKLGFGFFEIQANAVIATMTDSDLFEGFTNRKGWTIYGAKQIARGTELNVTWLDGDSLRNTGGSGGPFAASLRDADRKRLQTDLVFSF